MSHTCDESGWNGCAACLEDALREIEGPPPITDTFHYGEWDDP